MRYLIWSNEHKAWWRPSAAGYTPVLRQAGIYTEESALSFVKNASQGIPPAQLFAGGFTPPELLVPYSLMKRAFPEAFGD